eukprot:3435448-Prymnesium_polylepis.1
MDLRSRTRDRARETRVSDLGSRLESLATAGGAPCMDCERADTRHGAPSPLRARGCPGGSGWGGLPRRPKTTFRPTELGDGADFSAT